MSGELVSTVAGKIPQRALRYIDQLPYFVTYQSTAVIDFGNTGDDAFATITTPTDRRGKVMQVDLYGGAENFAGTTDKAYIAIGTTDAGQEIAYTDDVADGALTPISYRPGAGLNEGTVGNIIDAGDLVYCCGMDATGTPTGQAFAGVTFMFFE
jgi:hypothetical protein